MSEPTERRLPPAPALERDSASLIARDGHTWEVAPPGEIPWGQCPQCGEQVLLRQLSPAAKARCVNEHQFWAAEARFARVTDNTEQT